MWVVFILSEGFSLHPWFNFGLLFVYVCGIFLIPIGYALSHRVPKSKWYFLTWTGYIWMGFLFISFWMSTVYYVVKLVWAEAPIDSYQMLGLICGVAAWSLYKGLKDPQVRTQQVVLKNLQGLRAIHITDLHVGLLRHDREWVSRIVEKINHLKPDFIFLTGDLVEGKWETVAPMIQPLVQAHAKLGKFFVSGNHEFIHGGMLWEKTMKEMGWTILHNENRIFNFNGKRILLAGVPDRMVNRFDPNLVSRPDLALKTSETVDCKILLAHEPASVWDLKVEVPDLILSGHTHAGQIFPFNWIVRLVQPLVAGWKTINGVQVFAHPGTGLWGPPMRLGSESQIVLLEFSSVSGT